MTSGIIQSVDFTEIVSVFLVADIHIIGCLCFISLPQ